MRNRIYRSAAPALVCLILSLLLISGGATPAAAKFRGPGALAVSPDGQRLYVADTTRTGVDVIDAATHQLLSVIPVGDLFLPGLAVSPDGSQLYVTDASRLNILNLALGQVVARVEVGQLPTGVAVSPDGRRLYVTNAGSNTLSVVDTASGQVTATLRVGNNPQGLAVSPDGQRVYVADRGTNVAANGRSQLNGAVSVIDAAKEQVVTTVMVHTAPWAVAVSPDGRRVYVTHMDPASSEPDVIDTATNQLVASGARMPGGFSGAVALSPDSRRLYVLPEPWNVVAAVDPVRRQVIGAAGVGQGPIDLAVSPDGRRLYVSNGLSQTVSVVDAATLQPAATIDLKPDPAPEN